MFESRKSPLIHLFSGKLPAASSGVRTNTVDRLHRATRTLGTVDFVLDIAVQPASELIVQR